jgi:hypothetical protein
VDKETLERVEASPAHTPEAADVEALPREPGKEESRPVPRAE